MHAALLVLQVGPDDPPGRLATWFGEAGLDLDVRVVGADPIPAELGGYAGLVVLGCAGVGRASEPDTAPVRALLRAALAGEVPTLAIGAGCHQLALAGGGRLAANPEGPELGAQLIAKRTAAARDPLFETLPITPDVIQWHAAAITVLPAGAVLLASAPACENQAFRLGRLAWGVQFHIEAAPPVVRGWAAADAAALQEFDLDRILTRADSVDADVVEAWEPFAQAFAGVVREPDAVPPAHSVPARPAGPVTDAAAIRAALAAEMTHARRPSQLPMPERRPPEDE